MTSENASVMPKKTWKIFWDLQCPYSRKHWQNHKAIEARFSSNYDFEIHLTSLIFHPQAFPAQCAANLIERKKGSDAKLAFVDACFANQHRYTNDALDDPKPSEVATIFQSIAQEAGILDGEDGDFTKDYFLSKVNDFAEAVKPAYSEHKVALSYGVYGTPKNVINERLIDGTESAWGPEEWGKKLEGVREL